MAKKYSDALKIKVAKEDHEEIEDLLDIKVDVVTENAIHWSMKEDVLNGAIQL